MRNWVFVRIEADVPGLVGWGEATLEWETRAVVGAIDDLAPLLVGRDPRDVEPCVQVLTRLSFWRMGVIGISTPNHIVQEEMSGAVPWYEAVVRRPIKRRPGRRDAPERPGLGIEADEAEVARHPFKQEVLRARSAVLADGTVVDW